MKTFRIRTLFIAALALISTLPWIAFLIARFSLTGRLTLGATSTKSAHLSHHVDALPTADMWYVLAVILGLALAAVLIGIAMRRLIIHPLEGMRIATEQIAAGDIDIDEIPSSRVLEIAQARGGLKSMVDALQDSVRKQVALEEERTFVINAVAHDLRTPLFSLRGYLEGLERGVANTPEKVATYIAICKESSLQLDRLVDDLFTLTQLEHSDSDAFSLQRDTVSIVEIVMNSVRSMRIIADQKDISIQLNTPCDHLFVLGDRHLLARALNNLLDNAIRHTPNGEQIWIKCEMEQSSVCVSVEDSGPGFSIQDLPHVFEPLYRGETSRNRETGGAGLGLTIAKRIVRQHQGDIRVGNGHSGGANVTFWMPCNDPATAR